MVLRELHMILVELSDFSACATLLQNVLTHYTAMHPSGESRDNAFGFVIPGGGPLPVEDSLGWIYCFSPTFTMF
jgi:hypothetical protein